MITVCLGEDCDSFIGDQFDDPTGQITALFRELTGADSVTRIRMTMENTWKAYCHKQGKSLGFFCLYDEEE